MADTDSENEGILNNIQRLVIRPPGHTGKAKKGHICFDSGYETMNLGRVDFITNQEYDLFIRPDTANPRSRLWFHFTVENTQRHQRVIFNVVNLSKWRTLFADGLTPVVKSTSRPRWQRMQRQFVFYYRSPIHSDHFVLSFAFSFDREDERYSFALAQPYSLSRYNLYLESILAAKHTFLHCETIGRTIQDRPLQLLTITEEQPQRQRQGFRKRIVFLMARSHASEAPSSFIMQGLIDFLVSNHSVAQELRRFLVFKMVPTMNPDGVFLGNTMSNLLGQDLNRCWQNPNNYTQPTVHAVRQLILRLDKDPRYEFDMVIDIHSHISLLGLFIVGNSYDDVYRFERHVVFPKIMAQICPDFSLENTIYNDDDSKAGTARRFFCNNLSPEVNSFTLEVSLYGYVDPQSDALLPIVVPYTDDMYCRIGRNLARGLWDYYKILNIIPLDEGDADSNALRSFNLLRLRAIETQRNLAATSFDAELHQMHQEESAGDAVDNIDDQANPQGYPLRSEFSSRASFTPRNREDDILLPSKILLQLDEFRFRPTEPRPKSSSFYWDEAAFDADDEADWVPFSILELKPNPQWQLPMPPALKDYSPKKGSRRSSHHRQRQHKRLSARYSYDDDERRQAAAATEALSVRGLHLGFGGGVGVGDDHKSVGGGLEELEEAAAEAKHLPSEDRANSYRGAYADPRCEMKKRQQQEIVVSGLTINTSDIGLGLEEEARDNGDGEGYYDTANHHHHYGELLPDQSAILMSLIEPSVRKIGGGGAVSMSAFQASAPRPQGLRPTGLATLANSAPSVRSELETLWHLPLAGDEEAAANSSHDEDGGSHPPQNRLRKGRAPTRKWSGRRRLDTQGLLIQSCKSHS